jgi:hypothetical protein
MVEISKSDWKLFRERLPEWQEHYMERLTMVLCQDLVQVKMRNLSSS